MNTEQPKRTPQQIIGDDALTQLIFEGYEVAPARRSSDEQAEVVTQEMAEAGRDAHARRFPEEPISDISAAEIYKAMRRASNPAVAAGGVTEDRVAAAMAAYTNEPSNDMRDMMRAALSAADAWTRAKPVTQSASCPGCRGTGDQGGNPSYGVCDDCDGSGTVQVPTPPSRGEGE